MNPRYCRLDQFGPARHIAMSDLPMVGCENHTVESVEEVRELIANSGASHVHFYFVWLPQRPVAVDHPRLDSYIKSALGMTCPRQAQPVTVAQRPAFNDATQALPRGLPACNTEDMSEYIDS